MPHNHPQRADVVNRLARIEGHVRSIKQMTEDGRSCAEVLHQIAAVQAALRKAAQVVLEDHLDHCVLDATVRGEGDAVLTELKAALASYLK